MYKRIQTASARILNCDGAWFFGVPILLGVGYWIFFQQLDADGSWHRLTALPNPIFDWWFYMQLFEHDMFDKTSALFHFLAPFIKPVIIGFRKLWPALSFAELYFIATVASASFGIFILSKLLLVMGRLEKWQARWKAMAAFLLAGSILILRPGASSWYLPFFLISLLCVWKAYENINGDKGLKAGLYAFTALFFSLVYPWYFIFVFAIVTVLLSEKFYTRKRALMLFASFTAVIAVALLTSGYWYPALIESSIYQTAIRGGFGSSFLPFLTNTVILIFIWCLAWLFIILDCKSMPERSADFKLAKFMFLAWSALAMLWFQNIFTGIFITVDHYIYAVWIMSVVSWGVWPTNVLAGRSKKIVRSFGVAAIGFTIYLTYKAFFAYGITNFGGVIIHIGSWSFLAFALVRNFDQNLLWPFIWGIFLTAIGITGSMRFAGPERIKLQAYLPFMNWAKPQAERRDLTWCSDWDAEQILAPNTALKIYPNTTAILGGESDEQIRNQILEFSKFFHASQAEDGWRIARQVVLSGSLLCDINQRVRSLAEKYVKDPKLRIKLIGCDRDSVEIERMSVVAEMEARWNQELPMSSAVCDRFIVRSSMQAVWRIPASYQEIYSDEYLKAYGP